MMLSSIIYDVINIHYGAVYMTPYAISRHNHCYDALFKTHAVAGPAFDRITTYSYITNSAVSQEPFNIVQNYCTVGHWIWIIIMHSSKILAFDWSIAVRYKSTFHCQPCDIFFLIQLSSSNFSIFTCRALVNGAICYLSIGRFAACSAINRLQRLVL